MNQPELSQPAASAPNGQGASLRDRVKSLRLPDRPAREPARSSTPLWLVCLLMAGAAGWFAYREHDARKTIEDLQTAAASALETTAQPGLGSTSPGGKRFLETGGYLIPVRRIQISPKDVSGQVIDMYFEEGETVWEGCVLAYLDPAKYEYAYRQAKAQADMLKAEYERLQENYRVEEQYRVAAVLEAEANANKLRDKLEFIQNSKSAAAKEEENGARHDIRQAEEKVKQLKSNLAMTREVGPKDVLRARENWQMVKAAADRACYDLDNCMVYAPSDGVILKKYVEAGNPINPQAYSNGVSASLYDMADLTQMEVDVDISERDLEFVSKGQRCEIRTEAAPDRIYKGVVGRIMPEANRSKACVSARVRVEIPPGDKTLRPELRARVKFLPPENTPAKKG
jgi:multidrug resistance efflux pump